MFIKARGRDIFYFEQDIPGRSI